MMRRALNSVRSREPGAIICTMVPQTLGLESGCQFILQSTNLLGRRFGLHNELIHGLFPGNKDAKLV